MAEEIEIELDEETSEKVKNLTKAIKDLETQNLWITALHMFLMGFCLVLLLSFWQTETPASAIVTISVIIVELIDTIAFKIITKNNTKTKEKIETEIKQLIDGILKKGKMLDKII